MYKSRNSQTGLTLISIMFLLGLIAFFALLTLKIGPIYLEHHKVKQALAALGDDESLPKQSKKTIQRQIMSRLDINMVDDVTRDDIEIVKKENYVNVGISYEVTENIMGNLDVLVYFDDEIEVGEN